MVIENYIASAYNEDVAVFLSRLLKMLDQAYEGWDQTPLINILHDASRANHELAIREQIIKEVTTVLAVYGVKITDEIQLDEICAITNTLLNADQVNTTVNLLDNIETFALWIEGFTGFDRINIAMVLEEVHQLTIVAMSDKVPVRIQAQPDTTMLQEFTERNGINLGMGMLQENVSSGLPLSYYMVLYGSQIRSDPKDMVVDVYSIMLLVGGDANDLTRDWIRERITPGRERTAALKYLSSLR